MSELELKQAQGDIFPETLNELDAALTAISYDLACSRSKADPSVQTNIH